MFSIRKDFIIVAFGLLLILFSPVYVNAQEKSIQQQMKESQVSETIKLSEGEYEESIVIDKPIHLVGDENATLLQKGSNPAITIKSNNVIIENLNVKHIATDSKAPAILINGDDNVLNEINILTNSYGIQLGQANANILSNVSIVGNENESIKNRKHGIDLWESHDNEIYDTQIKYVQDGIYIEKGNENKIHRNIISHSRYGTHLMFTKNTELMENESFENISGMYIMGDEGTVAKHNILRNNQKNIQSLGLYIFDTTGATISENSIVNNRIGFLIESASDNKLAFNKVQGNYIGMQFKRAENNDIVNNSFVANVVQGQATESSDNNTNQNYWGDHLGLDITGNQTSDLTYNVDPFFLNITREYSPFQLLFQSPGMVFLEQLISTPVDQQLVDVSPLMENPLAASDNQPVNQGTIFLCCMSLLIISIFIIYLGVRKNEKV
ncbi:nitrous oxide reductase family maturation protein NosD [Gracilibacillus alcaliphilus]